MSIQGSLRTVSIPDLFTLLAQLRKTGVLTVVSEKEERGFIFSDGNLVYATTQDESKRLGYYLVRLGFVTEAVLDEVFGATFGKDSFFGQRLVDRCIVTEEQLSAAVQTQVQDILEEVMRWDCGAFHFDEVEVPFQGNPRCGISSQSLIFDVARKHDEVMKARELFPDRTAVFAPTGQTRFEGAHPSERQVYELLDGQRTVERLFYESPLGPKATAWALGNLVHRGLAERVGVKTLQRRRKAAPDIHNLPVAPEVASRLFAVFNFEAPDQVSSKVCEVLSRDPLLTGKLLKMLTLSNVEICRADLDLGRMVDALGIFHVRCSLIPEATRAYFFPEQDWVRSDFWSHSHRCAHFCRRLAREIGYPYPEEAFLAGLLHNLGAFLLLHHQPRRYLHVVFQSEQEKIDIELLEEETFGMAHTRVGSRYAEKWNFPPTLQSAIRGHHGAAHTLQSPILAMIAVANGVMQKHGTRTGWQSGADELLAAGLARLKLKQATVRSIWRDVRFESEGTSERGRRRPARSARVPSS